MKKIERRKACLSHSSEGIVHCTCGHLLKESGANRGAIQCTLDLLSNQNYEFKKRRPHGHRYGKTEEQGDHHISHNLRNRCVERNFEGIHDRFQNDPTFRDSRNHDSKPTYFLCRRDEVCGRKERKRRRRAPKPDTNTQDHLGASGSFSVHSTCPSFVPSSNITCPDLLVPVFVFTPWSTCASNCSSSVTVCDCLSTGGQHSSFNVSVPLRHSFLVFLIPLPLPAPLKKSYWESLCRHSVRGCLPRHLSHKWT